MPILPISSMDASRDPLSASILYAYTCYPKDPNLTGCQPMRPMRPPEPAS